MQNTIVKEFEDNPNVLMAVFNRADAEGETSAWLQTFWDNYYLRGSILFAADDGIVDEQYEQPETGLPFGRGFIIAPDGTVDTPYFGHNPQFVIDRINELLVTAGVEESEPMPTSVSLRLQNTPNPFNPVTMIQYEVPVSGGHVSLEILDLGGRLVRRLVGEEQEAGSRGAIWDGRDAHGESVASGVYFCRLRVGGQREMVKIALIR